MAGKRIGRGQFSTSRAAKKHLKAKKRERRKSPHGLPEDEPRVDTIERRTLVIVTLVVLGLVILGIVVAGVALLSGFADP